MIISKGQSYDMIISVDVEKEFDKILHQLIIKSLRLWESNRELP